QVPALQTVARVFSFSPLHVLLLTAIPGFAMIAAALLPGRIAMARTAAGLRPLPCWLAGLALLAVLAALLALLLAHGVRPGRWLLATALLACAAAGTAASARLVGGRLAPGTGPFAQLMIGLGATTLCLCSPAGLPALALLAPLGLGGMLLARSSDDPGR
ncbi:MAG: hypothetical protein J0M02_03445, partial [Planctomycetes bacterium]|nr:hypothetical protein [Planctomycetota bacterium]